MLLPKPHTDRDPKYLAWITTLPCLHSHTKDCMGDIVAHHSKGGGTSNKGSDFSCVPLCHKHHQEWHDKYGKKGPLGEGQLDLILESLQHQYNTQIKGE